MITVTNAAELRERGLVPRVHGNGFGKPKRIVVIVGDDG